MLCAERGDVLRERHNAANVGGAYPTLTSQSDPAPIRPHCPTPSAPVVATPSATPWLGEGATENSMQPGAQNNPAPAHTVVTRDAPIAEPDRSIEDAKSDDNTPDTVDDAPLTVQTNTVLTETATTEAEFARETTPERAITQQTIDLTPWLLRRTIAFNND